MDWLIGIGLLIIIVVVWKVMTFIEAVVWLGFKRRSMRKRLKKEGMSTEEIEFTINCLF